MPRKLTELTVFVSSPADLQTEHQVIEGAINDLNSEFSEQGIRFRLLKWGADIVPGLGSDPQAVINPQLHYDIYIGILGSYFGTPTPRAASGTEEEFESAFQRYTSDPTSVRVLFYFRPSSINAYKLDLDQLRKVTDFQARASQRGLLYGEFGTPDELLKLFTLHIRKMVANQWNGSNWTFDVSTAESWLVIQKPQLPEQKAEIRLEESSNLANLNKASTSFTHQTSRRAFGI